MDKYVSRDDVRRFIADAFSENRFATNYDYAILFDEIDELPAADVQPVKRGEWEKKSSVGVFRCSLCQHIFMLGTDEIDEYHFCPNCGARMIKDGETNG